MRLVPELLPSLAALCPGAPCALFTAAAIGGGVIVLSVLWKRVVVVDILQTTSRGARAVQSQSADDHKRTRARTRTRKHTCARTHISSVKCTVRAVPLSSSQCSVNWAAQQMLKSSDSAVACRQPASRSLHEGMRETCGARVHCVARAVQHWRV